jgi:tryptophan synthase alpha chain
MLEGYIKKVRNSKDILLMTHIVIGYPSLETSYKLVESMVNAGSDLIELQIPFSEPIADGPVILKANHLSLANGITVAECLDFAERVALDFHIPFLIMSYYNILFRYGVEKFACEMARREIKGSIVPDLPPEEGSVYIKSLKDNELSPIFIFSPTTGLERMKYISSYASGFIYCVARKGVTGRSTEFSLELARYLKRCREAVNLPLALGFGVKDKNDIDFLRGKADIAVIGTQTIIVADERGVNAAGDFIRSLYS